LAVLFYGFESDTEFGLPTAWPNEFEHRKNYEIEDEDWFDTDDEGWFGIEYAQLHVYQTRWEVAVFIDNNTVLFNDSTNFEIT